MLKRITLITLLLFIVSVNHVASADWEPWPSPAGTYRLQVGGIVVGLWYGIQQYSQPTDYTCGPTTIAMQMMWETHKKGRALKYDPMWIYKQVNTDRENGLTTNELKAGIVKITQAINRSTQLGLNMQMVEGGD